MIISDEHGWQWLILPSDPAAGIVSGLKRVGFTPSTIVLPREAVRTGSVEGLVPTTLQLEGYIETWVSDSDPTLFLRYMNLYDCCVAASGLLE